MKSLIQRTDEQGVSHHLLDPVRVYTEDAYHGPRISRTVEMAWKVLASLGAERHSVMELGCGTGDISGQLSAGHDVIGIDCNPSSVTEAHRRWNRGIGAYPYYATRNIANPKKIESLMRDGDLLILCEILEHLTDPRELVSRWMPHFQTSLISHPIDGDLQGDCSGGDHCWSYSLNDFLDWFMLGGHVLQEHVVFPVGSYNVALGWGKLK